MRETCDRLAMWAWRVWAGQERLGSLAGQCGNLRFEGEGMGGCEMSAVETNTGVGLRYPKYLKRQPASTEGGSTTEQQTEPGTKAFESPMVVGPKHRILGPCPPKDVGQHPLLSSLWTWYLTV